MKVKENYMLREIAGNFVVIPVGQNIADYKNMLHLNETGVFLWKALQKEITFENLLKNMIEEYEASDDEVSILEKDLNEFLDKLRNLELLVE